LKKKVKRKNSKHLKNNDIQNIFASYVYILIKWNIKLKFMSDLTTEQTFESTNKESLELQGKYAQGIASDYSSELGLIRYEVITFLQQSQPKSWENFTTVHDNGVVIQVILPLSV
jgi:hypothetical protein